MELSGIQRRRLQKWGTMERLLDRAREYHNAVSEIAAKADSDDLKNRVEWFAKELERIDYELAP